IAEEQVNLTWAEISLIDLHIVLPVEPNEIECDLNQLPDAVCLAGGDDVIIGPRMLEHAPHGFDIFRGVPPIPAGIEVPELVFVDIGFEDFCNALGDFPSHECATTSWRLMVKKDSVACEEAIGFPIMDSQVMGEHFCGSIRTSWMERCCFPLRRFVHL